VSELLLAVLNTNVSLLVPIIDHVNNTFSFMSSKSHQLSL
jgi:hypothetical protein